MCSTPKKNRQGVTFACRKCNACVATRRADWISRAMAEKNTNPFTLVFALTYADIDGVPPDGAQMFNYTDVQLFMKRLRAAAHRVLKRNSVIRFLCAGEQGSENGRCHWHIVIFSDIDLSTIGTFMAPWGRVTKRADIISPSGDRSPVWRRDWSLWPHGFVSVQEPDEAGMKYALSYALKEQFRASNSQGTMRETKAEPLAAGLFRMSKRPPIGLAWLIEQLDRLNEAGNVLPKLQFTIEGQLGYWVPRGAMRKFALLGMKAINDGLLETTGQPAPQWASLLANSIKFDSDRQLLDGTKTDLYPEELDPEDLDFEDFVGQIAKRSRASEEQRRITTARRRCGSTVACSGCLAVASQAQLDAFGLAVRYEDAGREFSHHSGQPISSLQSDGCCSGINSLCQLRGTGALERAFPNCRDGKASV